MMPTLAPLVMEEVEEAETGAAGSVGRKVILPRSVPREEEEETTSAGTVARRVTWPLTARSPRSAGGASKKVT